MKGSKLSLGILEKKIPFGWFMNYIQPCQNPSLLISNAAECTECLILRTAPSLLARDKLSPLHKPHTPGRKARLQAGRPCPHRAGISGAQVPTRALAGAPERARPLRTAHLRNRGARKFAGRGRGVQAACWPRELLPSVPT